MLQGHGERLSYGNWQALPQTPDVCYVAGALRAIELLKLRSLTDHSPCRGRLQGHGERLSYGNAEGMAIHQELHEELQGHGERLSYGNVLALSASRFICAVAGALRAIELLKRHIGPPMACKSLPLQGHGERLSYGNKRDEYKVAGQRRLQGHGERLSYGNLSYSSLSNWHWSVAGTLRAIELLKPLLLFMLANIIIVAGALRASELLKLNGIVSMIPPVNLDGT